MQEGRDFDLTLPRLQNGTSAGTWWGRHRVEEPGTLSRGKRGRREGKRESVEERRREGDLAVMTSVTPLIPRVDSADLAG